MDIQAVLKLADDLVFTSTGKHLDYLQKAILEGTLLGQTYTKISEDTHSSEGHIRDLGSQLWKIFSEELGENINKSNFRTILEKAKIYNNFSSSIISDNLTVKTLNICSDRSGAKAQQRTQSLDVPEIFCFYGRQPEQLCLQDWILKQRCSLISILGVSGIGKTSLALHFVKQIKSEFQTIIYQSLRFCPCLEDILTDLLERFSESSTIPKTLDAKLSQLLKYLRQSRCLIILDDVQMLFASQQLAGCYQGGYENYRLFFKQLAEVNHQSCLILLSQEKPREVADLELENPGVKSLVLGGLGTSAREILQEYRLSNQELWQDLIAIYQGHPQWLKSTVVLIQDFFNRSVAEFLKCEQPLLCESITKKVNHKFQNLTLQEQTIITQLTTSHNPLTISELSHQTKLSYPDLLNGMRSLSLRLFLEKTEQGEITLFTINPLLKLFLKSLV